MVLSLLAPNRLLAAARRVETGPYVAGAQTTRPWLRLLAFVGLSAAFTVLLIVVLGVVLAAVTSAMGITLDPAMFEMSGTPEPWTLATETQLLALLSISLGLLAAGILGAACIAYRKGPAAFLWPAQKNGLGLLLVGFTAMMLVSIALWPLVGLIAPLGPIPVLEARVPVSDRLIYVLVATVGLLIAAAAEEVVFRGVLLRVIGGLTRSVWPVLLLSALMFSAIHLDPDPVAFVARALSGAIWAWAALRLGGVAFGIGAHLANNLFIALLLEPISTAAMPGRDIPPLLMGFELVTILAMLLLVEILARRRGA